MKKILSVFALAAVLLGMASCNNDDVKLKRFNITVDNITATSAHVTITPPDEQTEYSYWPFNQATYNWYKTQEDGVKSALKIFVASKGTYDDTWSNMFPNTKYVLCVGEKDEETGTMVGDVEYIRFQTPAMEAKLPEFVENGQDYLPMVGEYANVTDKLISIDGEYLIPDGDGEKLALRLYLVSDKFTGHFTTDDMFSFLFLTSYLTIEDSEGKSLEGYVVCGADLTGKFNDATEKYEYKGTVDIYTEDDGLLRLPVSLQCTEYVEEEE